MCFLDVYVVKKKPCLASPIFRLNVRKIYKEFGIYIWGIKWDLQWVLDLDLRNKVGSTGMF